MRILEILIVTLGGVWQGLRQDFNLLELAAILCAGFAWKRGWRPRWRRWPRVRRPAMAAIALAFGVVALRLAILPVHPEPVPLVTDEFSHGLLADTLLHGRLTNPTHPMWEHFESLHIIQQPRYVSNYFPGHAAVLAAARFLIHNEWAGILSECVLFLGMLYWGLRGWIPARWALFGVLLAALRFGVASYWMDAFHGGFLPAAGGALVFGACPRLLRKATFAPALAMGAGLAILMSTRPFEGAFFSIPLVAVIAWKRRRDFLGLAKITVGLALLLLPMAAFLGYYFSQITGSPLVTAYQVSQKTYGWPMGLAWRTPPPIHNRHVELANYYNYELGEREKVDGPLNFAEYLSFRLQEYWRFFLGPILSVPLIMIGAVWKRRKLLFAALGGALLAILMEGAASPHYIAPATITLIALVVECCRHMYVARIGIPRLLPIAMAAVLALRLTAQATGLPYTQDLNYQSWCCRVEGNHNKARITALLERIPGNHLVLVKAKTSEYNLFQWIYNDADIDASRIVWARDLGPEKNAGLMGYFAGRQMWIVDPNAEPATCVRIGAEVSRAAAR